jgi:uncharacterized protein
MSQPWSMEFEWDARKAASNLAKHGVSFPEAMGVFGDPLEITVADPVILARRGAS